MKPFHIIIHGFPEVGLESSPIVIDGIEVQSLGVSPELQSTPLSTSFDEAAARLEAFPRLHFEPDGSFVWVSPHDADILWQVDGNLYDRGDVLSHVELKGSCPFLQLAELLHVFRRDDPPALIEVVSHGAFVAESDLRAMLNRA